MIMKTKPVKNTGTNCLEGENWKFAQGALPLLPRSYVAVCKDKEIQHEFVKMKLILDNFPLHGFNITHILYTQLC